MERSGDISQHEDEVEEGFGFEDMLRILRRHWRIILSVTLTAAAIATQLSLTMPNTYVAVATVQVEQRKKKIVDIDEVIQEISVNTQAVETEVEILSSSTLALRVIDKRGLRRDPEFNEQGWSFPSISALFGVKPSTAMPQPAPPSPLDKLAQSAVSGADPSVADYLKTLAGGERALSRDTVLQAYLERLKTSRIRNSHLIEVTFVSESPTKSAQIVNTIVATYLEDQINAKTGANKLATDLLNKKIVDMREKLNVAERKLETFKAKNDLFDADGRFVLDRQLNREMEALVKASAETAETRARFDQARSMISRGETLETVSSVLKSATVRVLRDELAKALRKQAELETKYGPRHPEIKRAAADVAKAESQLNRETRAIIQNLKTESDIATDRQAKLEQNLKDLKARISASKDKTWELGELDREVEATRKLYEELLTRSKQTTQSLGLEFPDSRIVQRASVPLKPSGPKRKQIVILSLIGGFAVAFAGAFLFEVLRPGFDGATEAEKELAVAQVGSLPDLGDAGEADALRAARWILAEPRSHYSEAVRSLQHAVNARMPSGVLLLASSLAGEGRTTLASNLAVQFAMTGQRTLLIDGDLRYGRLTNTLGISQKPGLADIIAGRAAPSDAILHDGGTRLHVLGAYAGQPPETAPTELLGSRTMTDLMATLREHFDMIVIDAPPVLPVADTRILAEFADRILMVVRWRQTSRLFVKQALRAFGPNEVKVQGLVMSRVEPGEYLAGIGLDDRAVERRAQAA